MKETKTMSDTATYDGKVGEVIETLKGMTALELSELKKAIEEVFDVTAAAPVAMAAGPVAAGAGEAEEAGEKDSFSVKLTGFGDKKIQVIKAVRGLMGLGLKEAKEFVDKAAAEPQIMKEAASKDEAEKIKAEIEEAGGSVELG
jgi:large subunit ribosomal protein L7/L12